MTTTTVINKDFVKAFRAELNAALADLGKKHGLVIKAGNSTYDPGGSATYKLEVSTVTESGEVRTAEWIRYENLAGLLELPIEFLGKRVTPTSATDGRGDWIPVGLNSTGTKVLVKKADGTKGTSATGQFLMPIDQIKRFKLAA